MADMPGVSALELGNPISMLVLSKAHNDALHNDDMSFNSAP